MAVMEDDPVMESMRATVSTVRIARRAIWLMVDGLEPDDVALADALDLWTAFDGVERLAANAKTLLAARVEEAEAWKRVGARSAAEHLAKVSGTTTKAAQRMLATSRRVAELPAVADALRDGLLSAVQGEAVADAAAADPSAQDRLIAFAQTTNVNELREEGLRTKAAADPDRDATHARIHARRRLGFFTDAEGGRHLSGRGTAEQVARIEKALQPLIDDFFEAGRVAGQRETPAAYAFDALVALAGRDETEATPTTTGRSRTPKPRYMGIIHLTYEALVRGEVEGEEKCEIVGIGPIPVRIARELLGDAILKLVITKGVDVANVVNLGRGPTAAQRIALLWTSPKCSNIACSNTYVQIDHRDPWANTHHTVLGELDPLCTYEHKLKTDHGWSLVEGKGRRAFVSPDDPRHPRNRPPPSPD